MPAAAQTLTPSGSAPPGNMATTSAIVQGTSQVETTAYEVYNLPDGRLGMRQDNGKVSVPTLAQAAPSSGEPHPATSLHTPSGLSSIFPPKVLMIYEQYLFDHVQYTEDDMRPPLKRQQKKRARPELRAVAKISEWLPPQEEFLEELLRFYGGEYAVEQAELPVHCETCTLIQHPHIPLHTLEEWNGGKWAKCSLRKLGFVFQLGHDGATCPKPAPGTRRVVIRDVTSMHQVKVRFCECINDNEMFLHQWVQLFHHGWFPATTHRPATVFTFRMLSAFQELNLQAKTNLYDYSKALERLTGNTGSGPPLDRYKQALHVM
ncbi:hypothetical protein C8Q80DRAFT_1266266 [Daedaleopsis nitida]|nr:hypothetical protein C8Q80DRAFT_1266266 [Daedaleopsis nitida]